MIHEHEVNCLEHHHSTFLSAYPEEMDFEVSGSKRKGKLLIRDTDLQHTIAKIAATLVNAHVEHDNVHFLINLRNGLMFGSDLLQRLAMPVAYDFIVQDVEGFPTVNTYSNDALKGKRVFVVQGPSNGSFLMKEIKNTCEYMGAESVEFCMLVAHKRNIDNPEDIAYMGYWLNNLQDNQYLIGYGAGSRCRQNQNVKALYTVEVGDANV